MKIRNLVSVALGAGMILLCSGLSWAGSANPPCPQLGWADGCNTIIALNSGGTATIAITSATVYDGVEDQLVGVINNSGAAIGGITLSGGDIFGFDGDGAFSSACDAVGGAPYSCGAATPGDSTGYAGPGTSFTVTDSDNGTVNFTAAGGLANGANIVFSLEEAPSTGGFTVTGTTAPTPEPGGLILLGTGLAALTLLLRRRQKEASGLRA